MKKKFEAEKRELDHVISFVHNNISRYVDNNVLTKIDVVVEEIFINIVNYAYQDNEKEGVSIEIENKENKIIIVFEDNGIFFNPLNNTDPNTSLPINEREIGGLGIYMVKKMMDNVEYEYKDHKNILRITKNI